MFESLSDRLESVFKKFREKGKLDSDDIKKGLREVRLALLEADVNYKVVKDFISRVENRALSSEVIESLTPFQQIIKIVYEELVKTLGGEAKGLDLGGAKPAKILLAGLQGSGKLQLQLSLQNF